MKSKKILIVASLIFLLFSCSQKTKQETDQLTVSQEPIMNCLSTEEKNEGWELLFDGKTTMGWRKYNGEGTSGWEVSDACLVGLGLGGDKGGDIITVKQFGNFILTWEWKLGPNGNSGVMYNALEGEQYKVPWETGPEYQLIEDEDYEIVLEDWQKTAADYAMYAASPDKVLHTRDWNKSIIIYNTEHVEYWLNGKRVVQFTPWSEDWHHRRTTGKFKDYPDYGSSKKGHIALQDHGSKVWFRNIKIKEY